MNILVVGATSGLGRQIVRRAIDEGHTVRCMVRNREKAQVLEQWGAQLYVGDLREPDSFEPMLLDTEGVVLAASALADRNTKDKTNTIDAVDDQGMRRFIEAIAKVGTSHVLYASMLRCDEFETLRLMGIKRGIERTLEQSGLPFTILRLSPFMQAIIHEYALPILEKKPIRVTRTPSPIGYISTVDAARYFMAALVTPAARGRTLGVSGLDVWSPQELISLCDELATVRQAPRVSVLSDGHKRINEFLARMIDAKLIDLLRFSEAFCDGQPYRADMDETERLLGVPSSSIEGVQSFMSEYFQVIKRSLRKKNYQEPKVRSSF